jgi:hypothetical protein
MLTPQERVIEKAKAIVFCYETALADGFVHIRPSDGKVMDNTADIIRTLRDEKKIQIIAPWNIPDLLKKVRF